MVYCDEPPWGAIERKLLREEMGWACCIAYCIEASRAMKLRCLRSVFEPMSMEMHPT